jgi:hypothetical protein
MAEIVHVDTAKMYASSSETGRKWMIGIFAAPTTGSDTSVSAHVSGEGALHVRRVNSQAAIFFAESKDIVTRKRILEEEAARLSSLLEYMAREDPGSRAKISDQSYLTEPQQSPKPTKQRKISDEKESSSKTKSAVLFSDGAEAAAGSVRGPGSGSSETVLERHVKRVRLSAAELEAKYASIGKKKPGPKKRELSL